jgi:hypothetical protein
VDGTKREEGEGVGEEGGFQERDLREMGSLKLFCSCIVAAYWSDLHSTDRGDEVIESILL